jgi:protein arginine kinase activator
MNAPCQRCGTGKATVHITDTTPQRRELHLCEDCAEKEGVIIKHHPVTANAVLKEFIKQKTGLDAAEDLTCPQCGASFREFQQKGLLGCPYDYEAFRPVLSPLVERAHGGATHHVGKVPPSSDTGLRKQNGLMRLRRELQEAIEQENYERAARVRDQIKALE